MASQTTKLPISPREPEGSRATRRLRRSGRVPGILYGGDSEPRSFSVDARELRHALAASGAVLEVTDGDEVSPAILKSAHYHPVRGDTLHIDLLRVSISHDVSGMEINDTITLAELTVPAGMTLLDDLEETTIATLSPPRVEAEGDEIEAETGVVGESAAPAEASGDSAGDSAE